MPDMNQSPEYSGFNAYTDDPLLGLLTLTLKDSVRNGLAKLGTWAGNAETLNLGVLANQNEPELFTHDPRGNRLDRVEFHPAWHALMRRGVESGLHNSIWQDGNDEAGGRNVARAARVYMTAGVEMGHLCPLIMTNASVATLNNNSSVLNEWLPKILSGKYDPSHKPVDKKIGVTIGMGMTERQGGSDVRANTTQAEPLGNGVWKVTGEKWFMSAPMCDAFLVLAQMQGGLGCFMLPRILDDGKSNGLEFRRLKRKLGNKSNASSEVEFRDSLGILIGEPGKGIQAIMDMVSFTRLDCAVASAGLMRTSLAQAVHHCRHRSTFGKQLIDQPLMERVLADMVLDVSAATALSFRLASAFDRAAANPSEAAYARLMTPVIKYWVCKLAPSLVYEAMECLGGNGYIEDYSLARNYREAPLDAIWEGAGNIMCLDVLRVLSKSSEVLDTVLEGLQNDLGVENSGKLIDVLRSAGRMAQEDEGGARILVEQLAYTAAAAELKRLGAGETADAFTETRLGGLWRSTYGMLDNRYNARRIIEKDYPAFNRAN
ncbi:MAG: acyl-CoA dehydrogenase family protein [Pseudomonadota bacterium]